MPRSAHCPPELKGRAFRGSEAVQRALLTREQLRSRCWVRLLQGIYAHEDDAADPLVRVQALALVVGRNQVICGRTAAWLHGVWSPRPGCALPVEVTKPLLTTGAEVQGAARRRLVLRGSDDDSRAPYGFSVLDHDVVAIGDLVVTSPLRTCFDLMRERRLVEAVVVADAFLFAGRVHHEHLAVYSSDRRRWPHVRQARVAVSLASAAARSAGESRLRMVLVLGGFEEPLVNVPVLDAYGHHVATPDLQVRGRSWAWLEYDGAYHEHPDQRIADLRRENRLAVTTPGVPVLRYDRTRLVERGPEIVLDEVATATRALGVRPLDPADFWRPSARRRW